MGDIQRLFGRRLKALRRSKQLTQEQLGQKAGLDYKHLGSLERGEKAPSLEGIEKLAKALKVEPYELLLPDRLSSDQVEQQVKLIMRDLDRMDMRSMRTFFGDLLSALRKLERGPLG